tara:strand:- start:3174 stop:3794 length:621 start_codon:yes stop_codon:yes gene_type:complete
MATKGIGLSVLSTYLQENGRPQDLAKFEIEFMDITKLGINFPDIKIPCTSVSLPGMTFSTNPHTGIPGPDVKYPYQTAYEDMAMTFMTTSDQLIERRFFEVWMQKINPILSGHNDNKYGYKSFDYRDNYITDIEISTLNSFKAAAPVPNYSIVLRNAYPIGLSTVALGATEGLLDTTVSFSYSHWSHTRRDWPIEAEVTNKFDFDY